MAEVSCSGYGKNAVRVMRVKRVGSRYSICEFDVKVQLQLASDKDYTKGDNGDVVATDTMKNTVYVFAKNSTVTREPVLTAADVHLLSLPLLSTTHRSSLH